MENLETSPALDASFFDEDKESNIDKTKEFESNPDLYRVSLDIKTVKDRKYTARGRFVKDPTLRGEDGKYVGKIKKCMYYLINPEKTDQKFYVECPSNWKTPNANNLLTAAFFHLWKHESATLRGIARNFKQLEYWWSLFQIMIDEQQPELQGKIKILRYGSQVNDKIEEIAKDQPNLNKLGMDVMNTMRGRDFFLTLFEKHIDDKDKPGSNKKITSYEKSEFDSEITSMQIDGKRIGNDAAGKTAVMDYLKTAPQLKQMESVKWDDAMEQKVIESMRIIIGDETILNEIVDGARKGVRRSRVVMSEETKTKLSGEKSSSTPAANGSAATKTNTEQKPEAKDEATFSQNVGATATDEDRLPDVESEDFKLD